MVRRLIPIVIFLSLSCVLLWPVVFGGRVLLPGTMLQRMSPWNHYSDATDSVEWNALTWDSISYFYPAREFMGRSLRAGELPLWNPYQMCGIPFLADFQSAVLYPPNLLFAVLPVCAAVNLLAILHLVAAGLFTYIFLRGLGIGRGGALFGGSAFMLGSFSVVWLQLPVFLSSGVWLPLILHLTHQAVKRGSVLHASGAGIALAMCLLGGHPQIAFYCFLAAGLWALWLGVAGGKATLGWRWVGLTVLMFGLGLAFAAPQLLPAVELAALSHRGGTTPSAEGYAAYSTLALPPAELLNLLIPNFSGTQEFCCYAGILPLLLIPWAFRKNFRGHAVFFLAIGVLGLMMALGTGVNRLFYFGIPGFANSGSPARVLFLLMFAVAALSGIGLDGSLRHSDGKKGIVRAAISAGTLLALGGILLVWFVAGLRVGMADVVNFLLPQLTLLVALTALGFGVLTLISLGRFDRRVGGSLAIAVLAADLLAFGTWYNPTCSKNEVYPETALISHIEQSEGRVMPLNDKWSLRDYPNAVLPPNSAMIYGLSDVQGYTSLYPVRYKALLDAAAGRDSCPQENGNMVFARNPESPIYDLLAVGTVVSPERLSEEDLQIDGCYVHERNRRLPRAFIVHSVEYASDDAILGRIASNEVDFSRTILVNPEDGEPLDRPKTDHTLTSASDSVRIKASTANSVVLDVEVSRPCVLVLLDQFYPGWTARVDGERAEIVRANYVFRAVAVKPGEHEVVFSYEPDSFRTGMISAKVALLFLACILICGGFRRWSVRKRRDEQAEA